MPIPGITMSIGGVRTKKSSAKVTESEPKDRWMKLSHAGHISDYHGLQRKFNAFLPLKYSRQVEEIQASIEKTLHENSFVEKVESGDDGFDWLEVSCQKLKSKKARKRKNLQSTQNASSGGMSTSVITFPLLFEQNTSQECICDKEWNARFVKADPTPTNIPTPAFNLIAEEPFDFTESSNAEGVSIPRSRHLHINAQKKESLRLLRELGHTLRFISSYNNGTFEKNATGIRRYEVCNKSKRPHPGLLGDPCGTSISKLPNQTVSHDCTSKQVPKVATLCHKNLLEVLLCCSSSRIVCPQSLCLPMDDDIQAVKDYISAAMDGYSEENDALDAIEQRLWTKTVRGYQSKADQERIEKKEHEEERSLALRKLNYKNRGKKVSAHTIELEQLESRPITYKSVKSFQSRRCRCEWGTDCRLCSVPRSRKKADPMPPRDVLLPFFKKVGEEIFKSADLPERRSRSRERALATQRLKEVYNHFCFIEKYNQGYMFTPRKRRLHCDE